MRQHGNEAGAWQILDPGYRWFLHGTSGCVGYVDTGRAWIAAGAPVAPTDQLSQVAHAFVEQAAAQGRRACFFGVEESFGSTGFEHLRLGEQPEWCPRDYAGQRLRRSLREQHRRARAKGVIVREARHDELAPQSDRHAHIDRLAQRWLATRRMVALDFVVSLDPTLWGPDEAATLPGRRVFVAEIAGELVGAAFLLPVPRRRGWYLKHLLRDPLAPNGAVELLVHQVLLTLAEEDAEYATLGLAPLAGDVHPALRFARRTLSGAFDFDGLNRFKAKLAPSLATPIHLTYPIGSSATVALYDSLGAFAPRGRLRFALASARRQIEQWQSQRHPPNGAGPGRTQPRQEAPPRQETQPRRQANQAQGLAPSATSSAAPRKTPPQAARSVPSLSV